MHAPVARVNFDMNLNFPDLIASGAVHTKKHKKKSTLQQLAVKSTKKVLYLTQEHAL